MLHASLLPSTPSPQLPGSGGRGVEQTEMLEKGSDCVNTVAWSFGKREQVGKAVTGTVCPDCNGLSTQRIIRDYEWNICRSATSCYRYQIQIYLKLWELLD